MPHKDPEARRAYSQAYKAAHREAIRASGKASYDRNRDTILARRAERKCLLSESERAAKRDADRGYRKTYRQRHGERLRDQARGRRKANPDRQRMYQERYTTRHRERYLTAHRVNAAQYRAKYSEKVRVAHQTYYHRTYVPRPRQPRPSKFTAEEQRVRKRAGIARWREAHPDRVRMYRQRHRQTARARETNQAWKTRNRIKLRSQARAFHERNREWRRQAQHTRYLANPDKYRAYAMKHHALKRAATLGVIDYVAIIQRDRGRCQICGRIVRAEERSFDHIIPLSKGGPHMQHNLRLTHFVCNSRRGNRTSAQPFLPI